MIQQQIDAFTRSLQNIATEYSNPSVVLQHMPVLKDLPALQANPEYLFYGVGGVIVSFFLLKRMRKRSAARVKNVAMVMPQPYLGDADDHTTAELTPASFVKDDFSAQHPELSEISASPERPSRAPSGPSKRSPAEQLEDASAMSYHSRPVMTPDEARLRVMVQAALNDFGMGYMIMARTALSALLKAGPDMVGEDRANGLSAIEDKFLDFGVFDRAGRCVLGLDVPQSAQAIGNKAIERAVTKLALGKVNIPFVTLSTQDTPAEIKEKIGAFLRPFGKAAAPEKPQSAKPARAVRRVRPATSFAAE